jgi:hypothetical protein
VQSVSRRILLSTLAGIALGYAACFVGVLLASRQDERHPAGAIVVLGAAQYNGKPSPASAKATG